MGNRYVFVNQICFLGQVTLACNLFDSVFEGLGGQDGAQGHPVFLIVDHWFQAQV